MKYFRLAFQINEQKELGTTVKYWNVCWHLVCMEYVICNCD